MEHKEFHRSLGGAGPHIVLREKNYLSSLDMVLVAQ